MWKRLFGPVLLYDLLTTARRGRHILFRLLYAIILVVLLLLLYSEEVGKRGGTPWDDWRVPQTQRQDVLRFNEAFFTRFMLVQFAVILVLTPGITAGAIAEEKERRTLEFLLTTELRGYEIVLGKLASRLGYMISLVLTGLPVLALLQLLGGVDPKLMLAGFAASGLTLFSLASLSILNSVMAAKPRTAIFAAYAEIAVYSVATLLLVALSDPKAIPEPVEWFCAGNPYLALDKLRASLKTSGNLAGLSSIVTQYALFHGLFGLLFLSGSLLGLRLWNRWQTSQGSRRSFIVLLKAKRLPPVGRRPVLWKELYAEPFLRVKRGGMILLTSLWIVGLLLGSLLLFAQLFLYFVAGTVPKDVADNVRRLTVLVGCLAAVGAAIHAAGSFAGERDRLTLDSLLATPLENRSIIRGKWWGGFLSVRKAWYCLAAIWAVGVLTDRLSFVVIPILAAACLVYAAFAASVGLWFSLVCRTTLRAMFWTLLVLFVAGGGHRILMWFVEPLLPRTQQSLRLKWEPYAPWFEKTETHPTWFQSFVEVERYGLTPPMMFNELVIPNSVMDADLQDRWTNSEPRRSERSHLSVICLYGLMLYGVMASIVVFRIHRDFPRATGRLLLPGVRRLVNPSAAGRCRP